MAIDAALPLEAARPVSRFDFNNDARNAPTYQISAKSRNARMIHHIFGPFFSGATDYDHK